MFIFQYEGLHQKVFPGEKYPDKKLIRDAGLDSIIELSKDYVGQNVVVVFDNTHDTNIKYPIRGDLVSSTFRHGILKQITWAKKDEKSLIFFSDPNDGKKILAPIQTIKLIDMVSLEELTYPIQVDDPELSQFFFKFFYHRRGETGLLHSNPIGAFVDGRSKVVRPGNECKQAYFSGLQSMSARIEFNEGAPERCTPTYERMLRQGSIASQKTYVIRCGKRGQ